MPNYNYRCDTCKCEFTAFNRVKEREHAECPSCHGSASQILSRTGAVIPFQFGYFEHISPDGAYARNKAELKSLCERHECYAPGVLD